MQVNAIIIGAGRSGTTSIFKYLDQHPQVCFSTIKEIHYFSIDDIHQKGPTYYHSFFKPKPLQQVLVSADTYLMIAHEGIAKVKAYNPDMKIIVMLRNPVDRAYSSYHYSVQYGYHKAYDHFTDSIAAERDIFMEPSVVKRNNLGHFYSSLYHLHLKAWEQHFSKEQMLILTLDELKSNPEAIYSKLCAFLNLDDQKPEPDAADKKHNPYAVPRFKGLEQFLLNREGFLRTAIRNLVPRFIKNWIINSKIVDALHKVNRKTDSYSVLSDEQRAKAEAFFVNDLESLKTDYNLQLKR